MSLGKIHGKNTMTICGFYVFKEMYLHSFKNISLPIGTVHSSSLAEMALGRAPRAAHDVIIHLVRDKGYISLINREGGPLFIGH